MACYGHLISIKKNGSKGKEIPVTKNEISVGSLASCDIRLTVPGVEQTHCTLLVHPNSPALLRNCSTNNPVKVNGEPIQNALLQDGDKISILSITVIWRSSSFKADKASRKSIATCVKSPCSVRNSERRNSEPINKLVGVVSPVRRSIDAQSPGFDTTRFRRSVSVGPAETSSHEEVTESLSQNVTVRRKVNARVSPEPAKRWSRGSNLRKSILRSAATPQTNKSVSFALSVCETTPEHAVWNVPQTPANLGFNASELSSSDSGSLSFIDLTNLSSSEMNSYSEDVSKITEYISTPGKFFRSEPSEPETTPQSSRVAVRFDESSARALLSPFNTRKSSVRQPATPYVNSTTKPLISFETPTPSSEVSSLMSFETPATASGQIDSLEVLEMKNAAEREKTPFRPNSSAKPETSVTPGHSEVSLKPSQTTPMASSKLKVSADKTLSKPKPKVTYQTPERSTQLIRLKKKPAPATPVLNLGEVFKTPSKQGILKTPVTSKPEPKRQTSARPHAKPSLNLGDKTPGKLGISKTTVSTEPKSKRQTPTSMTYTPKVLNTQYNALISPKGFSSAHLRSHLKCSMPKIGANLRNGMPIGKTRGTYFAVDNSKSTQRDSESKTSAKFIPKSMFTYKFTTPVKKNVGYKSTFSTAGNEEIAGCSKTNNSVAVLTPVAPSVSGVQTVKGRTSSVKTAEKTHATRRSVAMSNNGSETLVVPSPALDCRSNDETPIKTTFTDIDKSTPEGDVSPVGSVYSPGQTVVDLDFTVPPQNLSVLQNSDILLNSLPTNSCVTRKSVRTSEESRLLNSSTDVPKTPFISLQKFGTSSINASASSPFENLSNIFRTPLKTPPKNARSSTVENATQATSIVKTPEESDASKRSKTYAVQSTPNSDEEGLFISLAFSDVSETPWKTPSRTFNTINDASVPISGSGLNKPLRTSTKSNARSLCSTTTIDDATVTISASGLEKTFDARKSAESGMLAGNLNETADKIAKPVSQDFNTTYELVKSPEEWLDQSVAKKSRVPLSARKSKNNSTFHVSSKSPANISSRITRSSTLHTVKELSNSLLAEEDSDTCVTHLANLSGTLLENLCSRVTRNSTFDAFKTLPTTSPAGTLRSTEHFSSNAPVPAILINGEVLQTPSKLAATRKSKTPGSIRSNKTKLDYDESVLSDTKRPSKSPVKTPQSSTINEMSVTSRSNIDVSPGKLKGTDCETGGRILNETHSPDGKFISNSEVSRISVRKTRSTSYLSGVKFLNETCSSENSLLMTGIAGKASASQQIMQDSVEELDFSDEGESEAKTSAEVTENETYELFEGQMVARKLAHHVTLNTPSKSCVENSDSVCDLPKSPALNLDKVLKTPLKSVPLKGKTPTKREQIDPKSPMLERPKIPFEMTRDSASEGNSSNKTPVKLNATEGDGENSLLPTRSSGKFEKIPTCLTRNAVSPGIAAKVDYLFMNTNLYETELNYEDSFLPASKRQILLKTPAKEMNNSSIINNTLIKTPTKAISANKAKTSACTNSSKTESEVVKAVLSTTFENSSSSHVLNASLGIPNSSVIEEASVNDIENASFPTASKSSALFALANQSAVSPSEEVSMCHILNKSSNTKTQVEPNNSLTKENFNPEPFPKPKNNTKSLKKILCESTPKVRLLKQVSESKNSSSEFSNVSSITVFEPFSSKSARKSSSIPLASSPEISFTNVAAVELTALTADGGRLSSKVMKASPKLHDQLFEKSRSKLQLPLSDDPQSSKDASYVNNVQEWMKVMPCEVNVPTPDKTFFDFDAVKTPNIPKDVFVSPLQANDKSLDDTGKELKLVVRKRTSLVSKLSKRRSSSSFSRRSSGSFSRCSSGSSSIFIIPKNRLYMGKVPKRKIRFHPDLSNTPNTEQTFSRESSDEETIQVRRSTRNMTPMPTRTMTRQSSKCQDKAEDKFQKEAARKPPKKSTKVSQSKRKPVAQRFKKAGIEIAEVKKPVVPTEQTEQSTESSNIFEPQRQTRSTTRAKAKVELEVVENTSPVGNKTRAKRRKATTTNTEEIDSVLPPQPVGNKTGAKRRKGTIAETEEIDSVPPPRRQRRTRTVAEKSEIEDELAAKQEETSPGKKKKRQTRQKNEDVQTNENAGTSPKKTKSKMIEIPENKQVEQNSIYRNKKSKMPETCEKQNSKAVTTEEVEVMFSSSDRMKRMPPAVAKTFEESASTQTDGRKIKRRVAAKTEDEPKNETGETAEEAAPTQGKTRAKAAVKRTAVTTASEGVSPIKRTRSRTRLESVSQQTEEEAVPSGKRTAKVASKTATKRVTLKKVQTILPSPKKKTRFTNQVAEGAGSSGESQSSQRKTRSNAVSQKQVSQGKTGKAPRGRPVTRSQK